MRDELIDIFNEYGFTIIFMDNEREDSAEYWTCELSKPYGERLFKEYFCFQGINTNDTHNACEFIDEIGNSIQTRIVIFEKAIL